MSKAGETFTMVIVGGATLVATVIGVWILAAKLAYPAYAERAYRTEALEGMHRLHLQQEMFRLRDRTYTNDLAALGFDGRCTERCIYNITFDIAPSPQTYTARFVPNPAGGSNGRNQTSDDDCSWFTIDALGRRAAENQNCLEGR